MMGEYGKAVRVEIEWEDGTVQRLHGEQAEKYMELEKAVFFNAWNHGWRIDPLPWKVTRGVQPASPPPEDNSTVKRGMRLLCAVCREPQFATPSGPCCSNGHGGAPSVEDL